MRLKNKYNFLLFLALSNVDGLLSTNRFNIEIDLPDTYILNLTASNGCIASYSVNISLDTLAPKANIAPALDLNYYQSTILLDASISKRAISFTWRNKTNTNIININLNTTTPTISEPD